MKKTVFSLVTPNRVRRSNFDLSHERKFSCNMGEIVPILVQEVVPGDKFKIDTQHLIRFSPLVSPVMHRINAYVHYFYVPNRLLDPDWEKIITGELVQEVPNINVRALDYEFVSAKLWDHMGLPVGNFFAGGTQKINTMPFRAYFKIWNDYYRDENQQAIVDITDDVNNVKSALLKRAWEKDYFTSALPWAQKGNPVSVDVDLERNSPTKATAQAALINATVNLAPVQGTDYTLEDGNTNNEVTIRDVESASFDVESLRLAERLQRFLERNARAGSRYVEHLLAHWGILSSDARLQRAEYIGGGVSPVIVSEVLSNALTVDPTNPSEVLTPVGSMAGHAISVGRSNQAYKFVEEHGYIIGLMSIMPEPAYLGQGIPKMYSRLTQLDFYFPEFATLGEQAIKVKEIYFTGNPANDENDWGYQQRWAEYKFQQSTIHGEFKDSSLQYWHLARVFQAQPNLNEAFIQCLPSTRIFSVVDSKTTLYVQAFNKVWASRPMPYESIPY